MPVPLVMTNYNAPSVSGVTFEGGGLVAQLDTTTEPWKYYIYAKDDPEQKEEVVHIKATKRNNKDDTDWGWVMKTRNGETFHLAPPDFDPKAYAYISLNRFLDENLYSIYSDETVQLRL